MAESVINTALLDKKAQQAPDLDTDSDPDIGDFAVWLKYRELVRNSARYACTARIQENVWRVAHHRRPDRAERRRRRISWKTLIGAGAGRGDGVSNLRAVSVAHCVAKR